VTIATETYSGTALDSFSLTDSGTETLELDESDGSWTLAGETDQFRIWDSISNVADLWGSWSEDTVSVDSVSGTSSDVFANDYSTDVLGADSLSGTASDSSDSYTLTVWQYSNSEESAAGSQGSGWLIADSNVLSTYSLEAHGTDSFNWENSDQSTMSYYLDGLSTASYGGSCSLSAGLDVAPFQEKYSESESETSDVSGWTTQSAGLDTYSNEGVTSSLTDDVDSQLYGNESYFGYTDDVTETVTNSSWLNGTDGSHTSWVTESSLSTESGSEAGGGFGLGGVTGLPETSTDGSLLAWITREQGEAYPTNEFVLYDSPRTVAAYLSSPTGQLVVAGLGEVMFDDPFDLAVGFVPSTNAMTAHGLPAEKVNTFNLAENNGPTDGVSQTATSPPTSVLVTLAAAGRNPTDILIPTQAGTDGSGGDDDDDDLAGGGGSATSGGTFQAMADGGDGKSHEDSADQGWVSWMIGGMAAGLRKADQLGGAAMSQLLTGSDKTGEYGSFVGITAQLELGVIQGAANSLNGVADAVVGLGNLGGKVVNRLAGHTVVSERVMPDLSRDLFVYEGETAHNVSKFLGGNGVITILTAGSGAAGAAGSGARVLQATGFVLQANSTATALGGGATVAPAAVAGVVGAIGAVAGSIGQIAHMSVAGGPSGGGAAPNNFKWGNPKSTPTYGHTFLEHGKGLKPAQLADRARANGTQIGQYLDDQAAADYVGNVAQQMGPGVHDVPRPEGLPTRVVLPDGTEATADMMRVVVKADGSVRTSYPFSSLHPTTQ
jgi:hypothetical protein